MKLVRTIAAAAALAAGTQAPAAFASSGATASGTPHVTAANEVSDQSQAPTPQQMIFHWDKNGQYGYWVPAR